MAWSTEGALSVLCVCICMCECVSLLSRLSLSLSSSSSSPQSHHQINFKTNKLKNIIHDLVMCIVLYLPLPELPPRRTVSGVAHGGCDNASLCAVAENIEILKYVMSILSNVV